VSKTLADSNPFVRDAADRRREVLASVASSSAIEGIRAPFRKAPKDDKALTKAKLRRRPSAGLLSREPS
jgi:hypothetical protein